MASPDPEIQFAQRLASNERPVRSKAIKKLRTYINVRSHKIKGGFSGDELLKLWKGLFYCVWMQDKPPLQEELSHQIAALLHNFQTMDGQFLFLETFLQTVKREWIGIDRLRMDKFFQLVRFVFRQAFEMVKRRDWDSSAVSRLMDLLSVQVLQADSRCPAGLTLHILDLYLTELSATGAQQLTADQNLVFIEPFCKVVAKTRDGVLFQSICRSVFSVIIDQAPFAIEDLMRELKTKSGEDDDDDDSGEEGDEVKNKENDNKMTKTNGCKSHEEEHEEDDFEDSDIGPVLQFDYSTIADRLFDLASRNSTPSGNRQKLYRVIKVLRDLSEGVFPQDHYPEEVSTDEDDDEMFGSRKRMRRGRGGGDEEEAPGAKKKGKKNEASKSDREAETTETQKKKRKQKKKKAACPPEGAVTDKEAACPPEGAVTDKEAACPPEGAVTDKEAACPPEGAVTEEELTSLEETDGTSQRKKRRRRKKRPAETQGSAVETVVAIETDEATPPSQVNGLVSMETEEEPTMQTPQKKRKREVKMTASDISLQKMKKLPAVTMTTRKKMASQEAEGGVKGQDEISAAGEKKKIPVTFEFEADEAESMMGNGMQQASKTPPKKKKASKDFVTFQKKPSVPAPLLCRTRNKNCWMPKSESKKVTFGLNNNQTAEFRKSDRSLLLSPDRTRVPFDPEQKPKCGVLKSPLSLTPRTSRKTPRKAKAFISRPTAADFF